MVQKVVKINGVSVILGSAPEQVLARPAQDLSKRGPKRGLKDPFLDPFLTGPEQVWKGPGSDLRQCSIKYSPFGQDRSEPAQKWSKKGSKMAYFDPFLTPFWTTFGQDMSI